MAYMAIAIRDTVTLRVRALCRPLLLEGPPGSGKTALLEELARLTGNAQDMVCQALPLANWILNGREGRGCRALVGRD